MHKSRNYIVGLMLLFCFIACEKNLIEANQEWQYADDNAANIRIVNAYNSATPNLTAPGATVTRFLAYQDANRIMGNGLAAGSVWPSATYAQVKPGTSIITLIQDRKILATATVPASIAPPVAGDTVAVKSVTLEANKFYSLFLIGELPNQEVLVIEDKIETLDTVTYSIRLANLVVNPAKPIRLFSRFEKKDIFTNVAYKQVTDFIKLPYIAGTDTLDVFDGTTRLYSITSSFPKGRGRTYTIMTSGKTGFRTPTVGSYTNR